jgi:hypothetical protein
VVVGLWSSGSGEGWVACEMRVEGSMTGEKDGVWYFGVCCLFVHEFVCLRMGRRDGSFGLLCWCYGFTIFALFFCLLS